MTEYLSLEDLLVRVGELGVDPVRDIGFLDSAAHRPTTHLWRHGAYPSLDEKAAVLLESLIRNHSLVDGNTRLGWLAIVVFYSINSQTLEAPDDDAYNLVIAGAEPHRTTGWEEIHSELGHRVLEGGPVRLRQKCDIRRIEGRRLLLRRLPGRAPSRPGRCSMWQQPCRRMSYW